MRYFLAIEGTTSGVRAFWDADSSNGTVAAKAATGTTVLVPHNAVGNGEAGRRRNLALLVLPARKHAYVLMGDQVIIDADLPAMTTGLAVPFIQAVTSTDEALTMLASRMRLTVWKSTKRAPVISPSAPTTMTIAASPGNAQNTITRGGGEGAGVTYKLYRGTDATGTQIASGDSTVFPFVDTGRTNGTAYSYFAVATNSYGSTNSNVASTTPTATPASPVLASTFTGTDGTSLAGTSATEGTSSGPFKVGSTGSWTISSNAARVASGNGGSWLLLTPATTNVKVVGTIGVISTDATKRTIGIVARWLDSSNYVRLAWNTTAAAWQLTQVVGGTATVLATGPTTAAAGDVLTITVSAGTVSGSVNATELGSYTPSGLPTGPDVGISGQYSNTAGTVAQDRVSSMTDLKVYTA